MPRGSTFMIPRSRILSVWSDGNLGKKKVKKPRAKRLFGKNARRFERRLAEQEGDDA